MAFIAGQYTVSYDGATIGQVRDGINIEHSFFKQLITGDNYAETPQDAVYRGGECFAEFVCLEYNNAKAKLAFWPYHATYGTIGTVGRTDVGSSLVKTLLLTSTAGTPAVTQPPTITATRAILAEGFPVRLLFAPALREVPLRFRLYPDASGLFFTLGTES